METARLVARAGRDRLHLPRGDADPAGLARARRSAASAGSPSRPAPPVLPVAVHGTEQVRRGWRIRPRKVKLRVGRPMTFPRTEHPSPGARGDRHRPDLAQHRASVGVAGRPAAAAQGGGDRRRKLGHGGRRAARARRRSRSSSARRSRGEGGRDRRKRARTSATSPASRCPRRSRSSAPRDIELAGCDLVCLAVPSAALPAAVGALGDRIGSRAAVLLLTQGPGRSRSASCRASTWASASGRARSPRSAARRTRARRPPGWPRWSSAAPTPTCAPSSARSSTAPGWSASAATTSSGSRWPARRRTPPRSPPRRPSATG